MLDFLSWIEIDFFLRSYFKFKMCIYVSLRYFFLFHFTKYRSWKLFSITKNEQNTFGLGRISWDAGLFLL